VKLSASKFYVVFILHQTVVACVMLHIGLSVLINQEDEMCKTCSTYTNDETGMECSMHANAEKCISNFSRELEGYS
jgi:hypothetical protein